jgi:Nucleotidyl transferase AbiEii toxin, Type IV TA system
MLHLEAIEPSTLSVLKRLQSLPALEKFYLVGGTALALKYGHRISIDIDLFGEHLDKELILDVLKNEFGNKFVYEHTKTSWAIFCFIDNIKVDIVQYPHPAIAPVERIEGLTLSGTEDIAAMKINAILGRASKKDFWDIYELLQHYTLEEIITFYKRKFPQQILLISIPQALAYFEEANEGVDPVCLKGLTWDYIKDFIKKSISNYLK